MTTKKTAKPEPTYRLYYWPFIQGRGEFIRLILEDAGVPYVDVGRLPAGRGGGVEAVEAICNGNGEQTPAFAPPVLEAGALLLAQTPAIGRFLAERCDRSPEGVEDRLHADQLALTIADFVVEIHDTHHPLGVMEYYEDQQREALARAAGFLEYRMPKFCGYFERTLERNEAGGGEHLVGGELSYVDLWMFQVLEGLAYAFPNAYRHQMPAYPRLDELRRRVAARPVLAAYLASPRRIPFNEEGIFRHYPELDASPA
jgi:glutathione S-transferase